MAFPSVTNTFVNGTDADADEVNKNFADIIDGVSDGTKDISVAVATVASTLNVAGTATLSSALNVAGSVAVNTNKFTVAAASGNTVVAGTLGVSGNSTLSGNLVVNGTTTLNGDTTIADDVNFTGNFAVNTNKFTVASSTGNTTIAGTLGVTGATTLAGLGVTTLSASGAVSLSSTLGVTGNVAVNTNKFFVNGSGSFVGVGCVAPSGAHSPLFEVNGGSVRIVNNADLQLDMQGVNSGGSTYFRIQNAGTAANTVARGNLISGGAGDVYMSHANSAKSWSYGIDTSRDNNFVITRSADLSADVSLEIGRNYGEIKMSSLADAAAGKFKAVYVDENGQLSTSWSNLETKEYGGTFTIEMGGIDTAPATATASFYRIGNFIVTTIPGMSGTSTATTLSVAGIPSYLYPDVAQGVGAFQCVNSGTAVLGHAVVNASGSIVYSLATASVLESSGWAAAGTKGLSAHTITWMIC